MINKLTLCAITALAITTNATAADDNPYDWNGSYLGLYAGYLDAEDDFQDPTVQFFGTASDDGLEAGIFVGHNWVNGNFLYGLEADIGFADIDSVGRSLGVRNGTTFDTGESGKVEQNWQASLVARFGYVKDDTLLYALGGLAVADYDFDYNLGSGFDQGNKFSETLTGYTLGAGIEQSVGASTTIKIEYRYNDYEDASSSLINSFAIPVGRQDHDASSQSIRFGISRKM